MNHLKSTIAELAESFAAAVLAAIRAASLDEILEQTSAGGGRANALLASQARDRRRARRTPGDIASTVDAIETLLAKHPEGLRAEQIRKELGVEAKELPRPLADGVAQKRFTKQGQKRATTYFAGAPGARAGAAPPSSRRPARKSVKKR